MSDLPDDKDLLAGEYVLGTLDEDQRRDVRRKAASDPELREAITNWERRLAPLSGMVPQEAPPPALWNRIEAAIAPVPLEPDDVVQPMTRPERPSGRRPVWGNVGLWRATTAGALALAAAFAAVAYLPGAAPPARVAALAPPNAPSPAFLVKWLADGRMTVMPLGSPTVPANRDLELWILPPGAKTPASLGVLPVSGTSTDVRGLQHDGTQLMISVEPHGGSPTGSPTGPVVYAGTLESI